MTIIKGTRGKIMVGVYGEIPRCDRRSVDFASVYPLGLHISRTGLHGEAATMEAASRAERGSCLVDPSAAP